MIIICTPEEFEYLTKHSCVKTFSAPTDYDGRCRDMGNCVRCFLDSGIDFVISRDLLRGGVHEEK